MVTIVTGPKCTLGAACVYGAYENLWAERTSCKTEKGMTIEGLADAVGLSYSYMGELERGKRNPTLRVVENLAVVLETPPTALLAESHS